MTEKIFNIEPPVNLLFKNKKIIKSSATELTITQFVKDLAILINASIPLVKSLEVLADQQQNNSFKKIILNLANSIQGGTPFSTSLMKYPKIFDSFFINMIKAGEASSNLNIVLEYIAKYKEKEVKLKSRLKTIMIYPIIVIGISTIIISLLFLFIIPKFEIIFNNIIGLNSVPFSTKIILNISHAFFEISITIGILFFLILFYLKVAKKNTKDLFLLKIPFIGNLIRDISISLFSRILGVLITNAVPLSEALKISQKIIKNEAMQNAITRTYNGIIEGETLSILLAREAKFPEIAISLIYIGEETGTLSKMLLEVANKFDEDIDRKLANFTALLEPILTVFLAVIIGSIVIALFLPIIDIMNNIVTF